MKISLNIRPFITDKDERFESRFWEDKGILELSEATQMIQSIDWKHAAEVLRKKVIENEDLTIFKIMEPGFNLHNKETQAELFIGLLDDDFFDLLLTTFKGEEMQTNNISGLDFSQVEEIVALFYSEKFDEINSFSEKAKHSKSEIRELLINRDSQERSKEMSAKIKQAGVFLVIAIILYIITQMR